MKKLKLLFILTVFLNLVYFSIPVFAQNQVCYDQNQQVIPCQPPTNNPPSGGDSEIENNKKNKPTAAPASSFTPTVTQTPAATLTSTAIITQTFTAGPADTSSNIPTPTTTPLFGLRILAGAKTYAADDACSVWPISTFAGIGLALFGLIFFVQRSLGNGYISTHELEHASLNLIDEYTEKGLDNSGKKNIPERGSIHVLGLIAGGSLLSATGIGGYLNLLPCSWWLGAPTVGIGIILSILKVYPGLFNLIGKGRNQASGRSTPHMNILSKMASSATERARAALEEQAGALEDKLPADLKSRKVSDTFQETEDSRLHGIDEQNE